MFIVINSDVGGLEHDFYVSIYWECHHPNWLSYFQRGWNHQPDKLNPPTIHLVMLFWDFLKCQGAFLLGKQKEVWTVLKVLVLTIECYGYLYHMTIKKPLSKRNGGPPCTYTFRGGHETNCAKCQCAALKFADQWTKIKDYHWIQRAEMGQKYTGWVICIFADVLCLFLFFGVGRFGWLFTWNHILHLMAKCQDA